MNPSPLVGGLPARESMRVNEFNPNFLAAEMGAFPFTSKCALEMALTCVNPWMDRDTVRLWRSAEEQILVNRPTISLDEAVLIRDYTWFAPALRSNQFDPIRLDQLLCHMASRLLGIEGQDAVPHSPSSASHSMDTAAGRNLWMWIQLAVPEDLLVAALEVVHKCGPLRVRNVSPSLAGMLRREGFAEIHVHAGAAMEFELIWVASLVLISLDATKSDVFKSPGAELNQGRAMAWWLAAASVGRVLIAEFLALPPKPERRFATFVTERLQAFERSVARTVAVVLDQFINIDRLPASATRDFTQARNAVRALLPQKQCSKPQVESLNEDDPIASLLGQQLPASVTPDRFLIRNGLEHCCSGQDSVFASVYWQVIRVRCIYYRHLVMRPTSRGLQQFMRYFGRLNPGKQKLGGRAKLSSALAVAGRDHGLTAVELRATPEDSKTKMDGVFKIYEELAKDLNGPSDGSEKIDLSLILHFNRDRGGRWRDGEVAAAEICSLKPSLMLKNQSGTWRHQSFYKSIVAQASNLYRCIEAKPCLLHLWRGLDCCTDEQGVPAWVLQPVFRWLRKQAAWYSQRLQFPAGRKPLHATVHAGEDFIHLLTGLRNISESINGFELTEGDRIGHGLALGVEPVQWCRKTGRLAMTRGQRLFDLVWALSWVDGHADVHSWQLEAIEHMKAIFGPLSGPNPLEEAFGFYRTLYNHRTIPDILSPFHPVVEGVRPVFGVPTIAGRTRRLVDAYLHSHRIHLASRDVCWTSPPNDVEGVVAAQNKLRQLVAYRGLAIEVNPTSNLLIGDLGVLDAHPLWRLRSPFQAKPDDLTVLVGTDDPLIMASNLPTEYQRLADAMAAAGLPEEARNRWIIATIRNGLAARFPGPSPLQTRVRVDKITAPYGSRVTNRVK